MGVSSKAFIPFLYNEVSILFGKLLGYGKIFYFEPLGFSKFDLVLHIIAIEE